MFIIPPRPYFLGAFKFTLTNAIEYINRTIPVGADFRLQYLLIDYKRTVVAGAQTSKDLNYKLYDADGRTFQINPILGAAVTSPAGATGLNGTSPINIDYPGGSSLKLEITGQTGGLPAVVSVTFAGLRGWEYFGIGAG